MENHQIYPKDKTKKDPIKVEQAEKITTNPEIPNSDLTEPK